MEKEYIIWGKPAGETEETLLYTRAGSEREAKKVIAILQSEHGCTDCRIQIFCLGETPPDFTKTLNL